MGRIKGWKKTRKDMWDNHTTDDGSILRILPADSFTSGSKGFVIQVSRFGGIFGNPYGRKFRTKKETMKFAIMYMRSHPRG